MATNRDELPRPGWGQSNQGGATHWGNEGNHGNEGYYQGFDDSAATWDTRRPERNMTGRGPKNHTRTDERIMEEVCQRLTDDDRVDASEIEVRIRECEVTLLGEVDTRQTKGRPEDIALTRCMTALRLGDCEEEAKGP
jgi:osmotically-inducible protein OsmY